MRISDWSSDVCSSDLAGNHQRRGRVHDNAFLSQPGVPSQGVRALHFPQPAPRRDERRWEDAMIPTTVAGSLPKPAWLAEPEKLWAPWRLEGAELVEGQQKAALAWIRFEEDRKSTR